MFSTSPLLSIANLISGSCPKSPGLNNLYCSSFLNAITIGHPHWVSSFLSFTISCKEWLVGSFLASIRARI